MKLKGYLIVSIIFLAILTLGAVNAADNMTADDLAIVGDSGDFDLSSPYEEIIDDGEILNLSGDSSIDNKLSNSNNDEISNTEVIISQDNISKSELKAENTNIAGNNLFSSTGWGNQTSYVVNANDAAENVVTPSNFDDFFEEDGILKDDVEFDELIFKGQFNALRECLYITKALTITGDDAVLNNMAIIIMSDDVKLNRLTLTSKKSLGNLINVGGNGIELNNLDISYYPGSEEAVAIYIHDCDDISLLNSKILFESHVRDDSVKSIAVQAVNTKNVLIDLNNITTKLPAITINEYDDDYYMMGSFKVDPVMLKDCNNLVFTRNNIDSTTNVLLAEFPTIQSIYIVGCSDSLIDHNNISMIDKVTPVGRDNYMYGISFGFNVNVTFSHNNFIMLTDGGKEAAGTDYAFQGVESEVIIKGNNILSRSNGPNMGIYVASMSGGDSKLLIEDNVINVTGFSSSKGTWALVTGIEIQNGDAQIYNNSIYVHNVNSYDDKAYIYGISYAQWMYGDRSFDIRDNLIYTEGKYAVSVINATSLFVENNELYAHELTGDDSVNPGICENITIRLNNQLKHKIIIDIDNCWFGEDNPANITVEDAEGNITIKVNGKEVAKEEICSNISYTIKAEDIILGKNTVEVIYNESESKSTSFVAFDCESVIEISVGSISIGQDVPVTVSILGATGNVTVIVDGKEYLVELKNGIAEHTIEKITSGKHDIVVVYLGNGKKSPAVNTTIFSVEKLNPLVLITPVGVQYAKEAFSIKVRSETSVNVTINGKPYELIDGIINFDNGLDAGEYSMLITSAETEKYNSRSILSTFSVVKHASNIESVVVPTDDVFIGQNAAIKVTMAGEETGDVLISINGINYTAAITDKIAILNVNLPVGDYAVVVNYLGDDKYDESTNRNAQFRVVDKIKTDIKIIIPDNIKAGDNATVNVIVDAVGDVKIIVDGIESLVSLVNGSAKVELNNVSAGNHGVFVIYSGGEKYGSAYNASSFYVAGGIVPKEQINATIDISDVNVTEDVIVNVTLSDDATGTLSVFVDGKKVVEVNVTGNIVNVSVGRLTAGNHVVEVKYSGNDKYYSISKNKDVFVSKLNTDVKANAVEITEGETAIIAVNLDGEASGIVLVNVGEKQFYAVVYSGKATVEAAGLTAANYTADIVYRGDDKYSEASTTVNVKVNQKPADKIESIISITEINGTTVFAVLKNQYGNAIANAVVDYVIKGNKQSVITSDDGTFTIEGQKGAKISISYAGDNNTLAFDTSITIADFVPIRIDTNILGNNYSQYAVEYGAGERGKYFTVQLKDANGNILANKTISIVYDGKKLQKTTDENGNVSIQINIKDAKRLTFAASFLGDEDYGATMSVYSIAINKKTVKIIASAKTYKASAKAKKYKVTLKTIKGASINGKTYFGKGKKVTLKLNGKTYTAKTNSKGQATFNLKITKKGKFTASIKYGGDTTYKSISKSVKIKIK